MKILIESKNTSTSEMWGAISTYSYTLTGDILKVKRKKIDFNQLYVVGPVMEDGIFCWTAVFYDELLKYCVDNCLIYRISKTRYYNGCGDGYRPVKNMGMRDCSMGVRLEIGALSESEAVAFKLRWGEFIFPISENAAA